MSKNKKLIIFDTTILYPFGDFVKRFALIIPNRVYFYGILPYAYVLGVSDVWIKKFESIVVPQASWYESSTGDIFTMHTCTHILSSASKASVPKSSGSSGGGFSGGGFSGGGSGGGGNRRGTAGLSGRKD